MSAPDSSRACCVFCQARVAPIPTATLTTAGQLAMQLYATVLGSNLVVALANMIWRTSPFSNFLAEVFDSQCPRADAPSSGFRSAKPKGKVAVKKSHNTGCFACTTSISKRILGRYIKKKLKKVCIQFECTIPSQSMLGDICGVRHLGLW